MKRRDFIKRAGLTGAGFVLLPAGFRAINLGAVPAAAGLSDPAAQPKFTNLVPDAMAPGFKFSPKGKKMKVKVAAGPNNTHMTGLVDGNGNPVPTAVWGYGRPNTGYSWPGMTFEAQKGVPLEVTWENRLVDPVTGFPLPHLLPVDENLHWCYSLPGYAGVNSIAVDGVPIVSHLHGGHTDSPYDGNPEYFFSPGWGVRGPRWVDKKYIYHNDQDAGNLWYHDHALGITRLNVYAGLAGFYFIRDNFDTGDTTNTLGLPAWPYEKAYAIQDRMFMANGALFYPAFPGDPFYDDFITGEGAILPPAQFPGGGPTGLAEFFGDHMVVNGKIWPKENVEPRNYRLHLLNGTDSRFMVIRFRLAATPNSTSINAVDPILPFTVVGSDQGLADNPTTVTQLVFEPGSRYDIVFNFGAAGLDGQRIIMENIGGDAPFGGDFGGALAPEDFFPNRQTDRIMAFDVVLQKDNAVTDVSPAGKDYSGFGPRVKQMSQPPDPRQVALFEGKDEFGRLQPLLGANIGTANAPNWAALPWHMPTTENPGLNTTEIWEVYNFTGDAHPVHLHLVHFEVLGRNEITFDSDEGVPGQPVVQHNGAIGVAPAITNVSVSNPVDLTPADGYVENAPKDMVTALPGQVTIIKATFDKPGRYVWHCHILSHEDHEMMRVLHVGPGAAKEDQLFQTATATYAPTKFALEQNYPNPFNPSTNIVFQLPKESRVKLTVYDIRGREVKTLINNNSYSAGRHAVVWDAKNKFGRKVASGTYIYRIKAGSFTKSLKMNLVR